MEVATTTTEANLSAINGSVVQLTMKLGRIAARQDHMLVTLKKMTAALTATATTTPESMPGRVMEHQTTKPSSPSLCSANQVVSGGDPDVDAVFASTTPTRCSTLGSAVNFGSNHAAVAFSTSGTMHLHATTSISAVNNTLQGVVGSGTNTSVGCSTNVLSCPPDDPVALTLGIDTDMFAEVLTHVGGFSLFQELEQNSGDEVLNDSPLKDVLWYEELADCVLTHIGSSSLFLEKHMDTHHELEGGLDKPTCLKHGTGGVRVVLPVVLSEKCKLQQLLLSEMQYASNVASFFLSWDPGGCSLQLIFHTTSVGLKMNHENDNSVGLGETQEVGDWYVVGKIPPSRLGCFRLGKQEHQHNWGSSNNAKIVQQLCGIIRLWELGSRHFLGRNNLLSLWIFLAEGDRLVLDKITPWDRNAFSPWLGNTMWVIPGKQEGTCLSINSNELVIVRQRLWDPGIVAIYERPMEIFQYVHVPGLGLIYWCQMGMVLNYTNLNLELKVHISDAIGPGTSADVQLTEEAANFQSQSGNPLVFSLACHFWPHGSNRKEKSDRSWHLQLQDPCKCRNLCPFFGMSWDLEYKQWDPGIGQMVFECFLKQDQQILTAMFQDCSEYLYAAFKLYQPH